jgi:hypothetical protein
MRLWSIHPRYLDPKGLVALWREALLAQKVLQGNTRGYRNHPQLTRFRDTPNPVGAIAMYLTCVADEGDRRGYRFDRNRISAKGAEIEIPVTDRQVKYEFMHLMTKLKGRAPELYEKHNATTRIMTHPMMKKIRGGVERWEISRPAAGFPYGKE